MHDGVITGNTIDEIASVPGGATVGMLIYGSPDVTVTSNILLGGEGPSSIGIQAEGFGGSVLPEPSAGDVVSGNTISGFATATAVH